MMLPRRVFRKLRFQMIADIRRAAKSRLSDSRTDIYLVVAFLSAGNRGADDLG